MDLDDALNEMDTLMQTTQKVFDARHKFERKEPVDLPMALKASTRIDPSMLLAVDDFPGRHDFRPKYLTNRLMTKTNPEDWQLSLHFGDQHFCDAGILRHPRTW